MEEKGEQFEEEEERDEEKEEKNSNRSSDDELATIVIGAACEHPTRFVIHSSSSKTRDERR